VNLLSLDESKSRMSGTKKRKKSLITLVKNEYFRIPRAEQVNEG
jgi:hypothetical protein